MYLFLYNFRRKRRILLRFTGTLRVSGNSEEAGMSTYVCILRLSPVGPFLRSAKATVCGFPRCSTCRSSWTSTASAWLSFQFFIFSLFFSLLVLGSPAGNEPPRERLPGAGVPDTRLRILDVPLEASRDQHGSDRSGPPAGTAICYWVPPSP